MGVLNSFKCVYGVDVIELSVAGSKISIVPLYLKGSNWSQEFELVKECFAQKDFINPIVIGDLNVRIGELQVELEDIIQGDIDGCNEKRNSKDKVVNRNGKEFIDFCENFGLIVLNGMVKSDEQGNFTYIGSVGESVNDVCAISRDIVKYALGFRVEDKIWSDHMPITFTLRLKSDNSVKQHETLLPKLSWNSSQVDLYNRRLINELNKKKKANDKMNLGDLTEIINSAAVRKQTSRKLVKKSKWYNWKCLAAKKASKKLLRKFHKTNNAEHKEKYLNANKNYKETCEISKKAYYEDLERRINEVNYSAEWWDLVGEIRGSNSDTRSGISAETFSQYFKQLLNSTTSAYKIHYVSLPISDDSLDKPISSTEISQMLHKTKSGKAPGLDRITYEFFINADTQFLDELAKVYTRKYNNGHADVAFKTSVIFPIFKKGNKEEVSNYRGISFMNCIAKIMMGILSERLTNWLESRRLITEYQAGFRKKYSTADNIYNLTSIIHIKFEEKKKVYAFFVDFKAAFDTVPRHLLIYKLHNLGISTKMVNFIETVYKNTESVIWTGEEMSEKFNILSGVKQGCLMSPLLFSIYLNDLHDSLGGGIWIEDMNVRLLLYADDIVMLSEDVDELQKMIYNLENYCSLWNMQVNLTKSAIMVFRQGGRLANREKWTFKGEQIPISTEYNYLGVKLTPKLSFKKHVLNRSSVAKNSINATWRTFLAKDKIKLSTKWNIFLAVTRAIQSYAAQIWGFDLFDEVDKTQLYFLKRILNLPTNTPSYCILLETGFPNCHLYTLQLHLRYIHKTLFDYDANRLPHRFSKFIIQRQIFWAKAVKELERKLNLNLTYDISDRRLWTTNIDVLLSTVSSANKQKLWERALKSTRIYKDLDHNIGKSYFNDTVQNYKISWILKTRCDLIYLGGRKNLNCSLCNLNELENIAHFLGRCPILKRIRYRYFGQFYLDQDEVTNRLNGIGSGGWNSLVWFVTGALKYRQLIVNEYN